MITMTMVPTTSDPDGASFRRTLRRWYRKHGRHDLDWRLTRDSYAVLVSEVMLQQTQVERVAPYYRAWLRQWPDAGALAVAPTAGVIRAWAGLGYNRRAVNLQRAAEVAIARHGGIPVEPDALRALPGIGPYTAAAVACFAGERRVAVADTNIARVLARHRLGVASQRGAPVRAVHDAAHALLPRTGARDHNLALMDLGAMLCRARAPICEACPVAAGCAWRSAGRPEAKDVPGIPAPRFETTARFARGRIVGVLRAAAEPLAAGDIATALPAEHRPNVVAHLRDLQREGLAHESEAGWALPATAG